MSQPKSIRDANPGDEITVTVRGRGSGTVRLLSRARDMLGTLWEARVVEGLFVSSLGKERKRGDIVCFRDEQVT